MSVEAQRGLFRENYPEMLLFAPAKNCDEELEAVKMSSARVYCDLAVWSLAVMRATCKPWEETVKSENQETIESVASYLP